VAKLLDADVAPTQVFPVPPIPSDERFQAITTAAEIVREGEQMHHCVVTRASDAMAGRARCIASTWPASVRRSRSSLGVMGNRFRSTSSG